MIYPTCPHCGCTKDDRFGCCECDESKSIYRRIRMGKSGTLPQALTDKVVIKLVREEVSKGGIHIPPTKNSEAEFGVVVAEGPQVYPTELIDKTVVVNPYHGDRFKFNDVDYLVFSLKDILAVV